MRAVKLRTFSFLDGPSSQVEEAANLEQRGAQITYVSAEKEGRLDKALVDALFELEMKNNPKDIGELRSSPKRKACIEPLLRRVRGP